MAFNMEYDADSPLSYDVEEGELSSGSGRSSPGTIRDNASECSTQTDGYNETVTSMRVEVHNSTADQQTQKALNQSRPQEIAHIIAEKTVRPKATDIKNLESFRTRKNNTVTEQNTSTHIYQNNRPLNNTSKPSDTYASTPMPNYPPPIRPPPPEDYTTNSHPLQQRVH